MSWDFSTEPEFEQHLEWMRGFVRDEIWPLETVVEEMSGPMVPLPPEKTGIAIGIGLMLPRVRSMWSSARARRAVDTKSGTAAMPMARSRRVIMLM